MIKVDRRKFIKLAGVSSTGLVFPLVGFSQIRDNSANPLNIPHLLQGKQDNGQRHYELVVQEGSSRFLSGLSTPSFGINGNYLGPTLHLRRGDDVAIQVQNNLLEPTTLHWHGLHVPAKADGGPHQVIDSRMSWQANFHVMEQAGTFWYHSHLLGKTGEQVLKGLAGMIIVDDGESHGVGIPSEYGVDDIPLIVQDRRFNEDGSFSYIRSHQDVMMGYSGDTILVNGTASPYFVPTSEKVRFRLLNASNARTYNFAFSDGRQFQQIACDGGLLQQPVEMSIVQLAPAERCEIVVDFSDRQAVNLISLPMPEDSTNRSRGMMRNMSSMNSESFDILAIRPQSNLLKSENLSRQLSTIARLDDLNIDRKRRFTLSMMMGMGMAGGPGGGRRMGRGGSEFSINGNPMDMTVINETIPLGSTEVWEIFNDTPMLHPFHVHHGQFQILDRNGRPTEAHERAFKDTVKVGPGETVRIIMSFEDFSDSERAYMYHCHILEHEDNGMMGQFLVV